MPSPVLREVEPDNSGADIVASVRQWRFTQLRRSGFGEELARELADRLDVDLHEALGLVGRGCSPETAAQILR